MTKKEILLKQRNAENAPLTDYIGTDGYVWKMIENAMEEYANARVGVAMRWRDPKEELPDEGVIVFVKILSSCGAGDEILYTSSSVRNDFYHSADADPFGCEGYYPSGNGGRVRATVIGWRPIE